MDFWSEPWLNVAPQVPYFYKMTNSVNRSYNGCEWGDNVTHTAPGKTFGVDGTIIDERPNLCSKSWLHAYTHPVMACLLYRVHVDFPRPVLWLCTGDAEASTIDYKVGCTKLTTLEKLRTPQISDETRIRFALIAASKVYMDEHFLLWSTYWKGSEDRAIALRRAKQAAEKISLMQGKGIDTKTSADYHASMAAHSAAGALSVFKTQEKNGIEFLTACAAVYANRAAWLRKHEFSLVHIAEQVMAA